MEKEKRSARVARSSFSRMVFRGRFLFTAAARCRRRRSRAARCAASRSAAFPEDEEIERNQNHNHKDCHYRDYSGAAAATSIISHDSILLKLNLKIQSQAGEVNSGSKGNQLE